MDAGLRSRAESELADLAAGGDPLGPSAGLVEPEDAFTQLIGSDGNVIATSPGLADAALLTPAEAAALDGPTFLDRDVSTAEETGPARLFAVPAGDGRVAW